MDPKERQHLLTGTFILTGVLLLLTMLFFLGLSDLFTHKVPMRTGFTESIQGLSKGSAVKYRGVQIGTVSDISILVKENIIQIDMEIDPQNFARDHRYNVLSDAEFRKFFKTEIKEKGLRARLEMLGITGMKYIDFDYFAPPGTPVPQEPLFAGKKHIIFVPGVPSQLKNITGTLTASVARLSKIPFERISDQLETALINMGQILGSQELRLAISRINDTAENLEKSSNAIANVLSEERMLKLTDQFEKILANIDELQKSVSKITTDSRIPETTAAFREAMETVSERRLDLAATLAKFDQTLESIRALADYLSTDPASLLRGKPQKTPRKNK